MKKSLIVLIATILLSVSIYTVRTYNSSNSENQASQESSAKSTTSQSNSNNASTKTTGINPNIIKTKAIDFKLKDLDGK